VLANDVEFLSSQVPPHSVFFFDRVAPGTLQMARWSRDKGALVIFEPSGIKDERLFTECLRASHVVKYSNERIEGVHGLVDAAKVPVEIETLGTSGLRLRSRDKGRAGSWVDLPAFSASSLVDAAGSGDWCTAGFLQYLFSNGSQGVDIISSADAVVAAVQFGQALATLNCGFEGARGLMYAASARRVAALADAIVSGREISLGLGGAKKVQVSPRRTKSTCGICSNALLTPA
jgi:fructokinase